MQYGQKHRSILKRALADLVELLMSPTCSDRDADANQADLDLAFAQSMLSSLDAREDAVSAVVENLLACKRLDDKLDDAANNGREAVAPDGDSYNELWSFVSDSLRRIQPVSTQSDEHAVLGNPHQAADTAIAAHEEQPLSEAELAAVSTAGELLIRAAAALGTLRPETQRLLGTLTEHNLPACLAMALRAAAAISPQTSTSLNTHGPAGFIELAAP